MLKNIIQSYMTARRNYILGNNSCHEAAVTLRNILMDEYNIAPLAIIVLDDMVDRSISLSDIYRM